MIPTESINEKRVLEALLEKMPLTAMLRNLGRYAAREVTKDRTSWATKHIVGKLTDLEALRKGRIHPVSVLNTLRVYRNGRGDRGDLNWTPNEAILDALSEAFELSFQAVEPCGKSMLVAVDVSGSMSCPVGGYQLSCREIAAAIALTFVKTEPNVELIYFDDRIHQVKGAGKRTSYDDIMKSLPHGGGTDLSLPYKHLWQQNLKLDAVITLTDNETWAGGSHPVQEHERYLKAHPSYKAAIVAMACNHVSVLPENTENALGIAGFDAAVPTIITNFLT
jgi:60 kDa SS-A/Ro ribonucleoprotein